MELAARLLRLFHRPLLNVGQSGGDPSDPFGAGFERKLELLNLLNRRMRGRLFRAERRARRRGSGLEFADHREYVPGDDFRFVDVNAAMRLDRLLLRLYEEEEDQSLYLLLDASLSMGQHGNRKFDHARRLAAAIAYLGLAQLARVTVVALGEGKNLRYPTSRGKSQFLSILRFLRGLEPRGKTALEPALRHFAKEQRRRGVSVLLSDLYDPAGFERGLDVLRYERFHTHVLHVTDEADLLPDVHGDVTIVDSETGGEYPVTMTAARRAGLRDAQRQLTEQVERHCRGHGLGYLRTDANDDFEAIIRRLLSQQGQHST